MKTIKTFKVSPSIPKRLQPLLKIAYNLWWTWNPQAMDLLRQIDVILWTKYNHNPIQLLHSISQDKFKELEESESFCSNMDMVEVELDSYLLRHSTWFSKTNNSKSDFKIAYFSAEFGLHECLPIYSGGLGVLAGDHLKSSDEIGLPLIGVGLCYRQGYFHQLLNADGWQQEFFPENDFHSMSLKPVNDDNNNPILIDVDFPGRKVYAKIWEVNIGNISLFLLDSNVDANSHEDREITARLYGGNEETRIKQEIILGIGGAKFLKIMKFNITVFHMNEGHSAFLAVERIKQVMNEYSLTFNEAKELVSATNVFTTHTPVPAGLDRFAPQLIDKFFSNYYGSLGISRDAFLALGRSNIHDHNEPFSMAILALSLSYMVNGVSKLHREVSKRMWNKLWPDVPFKEIPISSVTNGIHLRSWLSDEISRLYDRYLGRRWYENTLNSEMWNRVIDIPDTELWRSQVRLKDRLISFARFKLKSKLKRVGAPQFEINRADEVLDPEALTICFARRFATYKRAILILKDKNRLSNILNNKKHPVQLIFSGKAHPHDNEGKEFIRQLIHLTRDERFRTRIMFIEDYDMNIARYMVQGADIWLNTPRRPLEASGTSGMKAAINGVLNLSILDGWWCEAYNSANGWAIGGGEVYDDNNYQDDVEGNALYDLLEYEIIPTYYRRGPEGISRTWIAKMKESIKSITPVFNTNRMVSEYAKELYFNTNNNYLQFTQDNMDTLKKFAIWKDNVIKLWSGIKVGSIDYKQQKNFIVGEEIEITAKVELGKLFPKDVSVELYYGPLDGKGNIDSGNTLTMHHKGEENELFRYCGNIKCIQSGQYGFSVRVLPYHKDLVNKFNPHLIKWG